MSANDSQSPDIMNVREIIEYAFGDFDDNTVNFKLVQTVLLLIARQLRVLERRVEVELGPLTLIPAANTLSITEVKIHAAQKKGKKPKQAGAAGVKPGMGGPQAGGGVGRGRGAGGGGGVGGGGGTGGDGGTGTRTRPGTKPKKTGQQSSSSDKTSTDKTSTDKTSTDKTSTDKTSTDKTSTDKTSTDKTSTDKTSSTDKTTSTDKTSTDRTTTTDKTTSSADKTPADKTASSTESTSSDKTSTETTSQMAKGQKPYSNPDILSTLEELRERELRIIHQRTDSFEEATKSPTPMASVSSVQKQYETLLVVKKVPSKDSRSGETGQQRIPQISVVTQDQFKEVADAVRKLEKKFLPVSTPGFPERAELMEELRKGASLTDAMAALQLSARLEATEKVLGQMIAMVTDLASQIPSVDESKKQVKATAEIGQSQRGFDAGVVPTTKKLDGPSQTFGAGTEASSIGGGAKSTKSFKEPFSTTPTGETASRVDTVASTAKTKTSLGVTGEEEEPPGEESKDGVYVSFSDLQRAAKQLYDELLQKLKADTTRTTSTAETAFRMSSNLESKLDRAIMVSSRMNDLENVVKQYAEQVNALDTGLTSQMTSYQEQLTQMQHDLEIGVETISELLASSSGDVEAVAELHSNFTNLQVDLEVMAFRQKELSDSQNSTAYDLENLWREIEMLRDTKSDREEVADALRDKAGLAQLNGLVALPQFEAVRGDFEKRIGAAYDKFNNQEHVWQKCIDELIKVLNEKGDLLQVETLKDDIYKHLNRIKARLKIIADIVGEPKSAMVNKKVFRDTTCISCGSPAHMDLEEPSKVPALPKFPSGREPAEGAEAESQTKGGGDSQVCYPDMPIPHPRDPRSHICKRYCGGSHTVITDGLNRTLPGLVVQPANRPFNTAPGTDGKLYMVDEQTKKVPCLACNMPTPPPVIPEPEPPIRAPIDSIDEFWDISLTPPAQDRSY